MKKVISLILAISLALCCLCAVYAEGVPVAKIELSKSELKVGDTVVATLVIDNNESQGFFGADAAIFFNKNVLEYDKAYGVKMNPALEDLGMALIFTKAEDSLVRGAVAIKPDAYKNEITKAGSKVSVWSVQFKVIAEGDTGLCFAVKGESADFFSSLPEGLMVYLDTISDTADVEIQTPEVLVGAGEPSVMITEIIGVPEIKVPVGTSAEDVLKKLPQDVEVKLDNGKTDKVKMSWMSGSLISGYDGNTPGEYYFTGNIVDSGEYVNYKNLFSMVKIIVEGEKADAETPQAPKTTIVMAINSNKPLVNGTEVEIDVPAVIMENRTFTPARFVAEALGAKVDWDAENRVVTITRGEKVIKLTINSNIALVDGAEVAIDAPARIVNNRTLTPARFVAEALGAKVDWNDETRTVTITE